MHPGRHIPGFLARAKAEAEAEAALAASKPKRARKADAAPKAPAGARKPILERFKAGEA